MSEKRYQKAQRQKSRMVKKKKRLREARRMRRLLGRQQDLASSISTDFGFQASPPTSLLLGLGAAMAVQLDGAPDLGEQQRLMKMRLNKIHGAGGTG